MGYVLAATRISNGERAAIKMLLPHVAGLPDIVERFKREARAASAIDSVHCARYSTWAPRPTAPRSW
jgi:hypothetical protein